jgi:hypothetical protein
MSPTSSPSQGFTTVKRQTPTILAQSGRPRSLAIYESRDLQETRDPFHLRVRLAFGAERRSRDTRDTTDLPSAEYRG